MLRSNLAEPLLFTVDDLEKMITAGIFDDRSGHIELIEGELLQMSPASERHDILIRRLNTWSGQQQTENQFEIAVQMGLRLHRTESMPEPDLYWVKSGRSRRPDTSVVPLVIEVALSSLRYDREDKTRLYALDDLQEYWLVDIAAEAVEVRTEPNGEGFDQLQVFRRGQSLHPICLPTATLDLDWLFAG